MGLDPEWARPDWMVMTVFPVPPPAVRPSILMGSMARGEDDLTHKLSDIIKVGYYLTTKCMVMTFVGQCKP
jgi:DNA-directed RNA polymerase II subunit RPB1